MYVLLWLLVVMLLWSLCQLLSLLSVQLLLPGVQIWLDVDCLDDVGKLEESVQRSLTAIIFLSQGYFASAKCRRELRADRPLHAQRLNLRFDGAGVVSEPPPAAAQTQENRQDVIAVSGRATGEKGGSGRRRWRNGDGERRRGAGRAAEIKVNF